MKKGSALNSHACATVFVGTVFRPQQIRSTCVLAQAVHWPASQCRNLGSIPFNFRSFRSDVNFS
jgi:hypothetical protein